LTRRQKLVHLNALRAFEAAARHLSFVAAADELNVTPSAISQQIRALEEYLDVPLFVRSKVGVTLTPQARATDCSDSRKV
jgi:LysR family transcriptional regulator, glycine cleavage system transcriptional activator